VDIERRRLKSLLLKCELDFCCPHCGEVTRINSRLLEAGALKKGKFGPPKKGNDEAFLEGLEWHLREMMRQTGRERRPALQLIAGGIYQVLKNPTAVAVSAEALAHRWERKLRDGGFDKRRPETLKKRHGVLLSLLLSLDPR
jgi:hypothetical protein